jgi:hypothetical protein
MLKELEKILPPTLSRCMLEYPNNVKYLSSMICKLFEYKTNLIIVNDLSDASFVTGNEQQPWAPLCNARDTCSSFIVSKFCTLHSEIFFLLQNYHPIITVTIIIIIIIIIINVFFNVKILVPNSLKNEISSLVIF